MAGAACRDPPSHRPTCLVWQELREDWNLELPFKLKQGQVEVEEAAVVTDFGGALLIHRSEVAELNGSVRQLGREKVVILKEIRDFRKGIVRAPALSIRRPPGGAPHAGGPATRLH